MTEQRAENRFGDETGRVEQCGQPAVQLPRSLAELKRLVQQLRQDQGGLQSAQELRQRVVSRLRSQGQPLDLLAADVLAEDAVPGPSPERLLQDPVSYGLRYQLCQDQATRRPQAADPASCAPFTGAGWAALEPDNGRAWLAALMEAREAKDAGAEARAWTALSLATRFDQREGLLGQQVLRSAGDANEAERLGLVLLADALPSGPAMQRLFGDKVLRDACKGSVTGDGQRREECRRLARHLSQGGSTIGDKRLALKLAAASGLEATALAVSETAVLAAEAWRSSHAPMLNAGESQPFGCRALRQDLDRLTKRAELGEWLAVQKEMTPN